MTNPTLSASELKAYVETHYHYDHRKGLFFWKKLPNAVKNARVGDVVGSLTKDGRKLRLFGQNISNAKVVFFAEKGRIPQFLSHKSSDIKDDRIDNLIEFSSKSAMMQFISNRGRK